MSFWVPLLSVRSERPFQLKIPMVFPAAFLFSCSCRNLLSDPIVLQEIAFETSLAYRGDHKIDSLVKMVTRLLKRRLGGAVELSLRSRWL